MNDTPRSNDNPDDQAPKQPGEGSGSQGSPQDPYTDYFQQQSGGFRPYPGVNHPEDAPGFGAQDPTGSANAYGAPNYGLGPGAGGFATEALHPRLQWPLRRDNGRFSFGEAFSYGFKAVFLDPWLWILGALIYFVLSFGISYGANSGNSDTGLSDFTVSVISMFFTPFIYHLALRSIDGVKLSVGVAFDGIRYLPILGATIVTGIISALAMAPMWLGFLATGFANMDTGVTEDEAISLLLQFLLWAAVGLLVALFVTPFTVLFPFYLADGHGFGESWRANFADVKRNYGTLLGFVVVSGIFIAIGGLITIGIGLIILLPFYYNALAYIYRSISGQTYPTREIVR